ncbi:MAG: tetratricopeptide repeat protein [Cyclobacteriaceae bacterium]
MRLFLTILVIANVIIVCAQTTKPLIDKGDKFFSKGDYKSALQNYQEAEKITPKDAKIKYRIGHVFMSLGNDAKALQYLDEAYREQPNVDPDIEYFLGLALQANYHFNRAIQHFSSYKSKVKRMSLTADHKIRECKLGDSLMNHPILCAIKILEWPVNSIYRDYGPTLPQDESELIFTSARDTANTDKKYQEFFEDVLVSEHQGDQWTTPKKISPRINDTFHDAAIYLTPDGKTIFSITKKGMEISINLLW